MEARFGALEAVADGIFGDVEHAYRSLIVVDPALDDKETRVAAVSQFAPVAGRVELFGVDPAFGLVGELRQLAAAGRVDGAWLPGQRASETLF